MAPQRVCFLGDAASDSRCLRNSKEILHFVQALSEELFPCLVHIMIIFFPPENALNTMKSLFTSAAEGRCVPLTCSASFG